MSNTDTPADRLLAILSLDPSDLAADIVQAADGHDGRMNLIKSLLDLTAAIASEVGDDMEAMGDGYDVDRETGETHGGNGPEEEARAYALHLYTCGEAANDAARACWKASEAFTAAEGDATALPDEVSAQDFVAALKTL
jgi:hypothetical protein